jgi:hypothetical protein
MKVRHILLLLAAAFTLGSCQTSKTAATHVQEYRRDSTRVEYRLRTVLVPDTVYLEIPHQTAERTTRDSVSHLENDYAITDARLNADGTLLHTLLTKPQKKSVFTHKEIEYRDSIVYRDVGSKLTKTITKRVPHERSWWEQTQIYGFWACLLALCITYHKAIYKVISGFL